jgi:hypothetical protein
MSEMLGSLATDPTIAAYTVAAVLVAGLVRGFTGFGMSAVIVLALSMTLPPAEVVPVALVLEVAASARMLPAAWKDVDWTYARGLLAGGAVGIPVGVALLVYVAPDLMRVALSVFVLAMSGAILGGFRFRGRPGTRWGYGVGLVAGVANGAASFGGQPTALFLLSTPIAAAAARATLIFLAIVTSAYGALMAHVGGLLGGQELAHAALLVIPMAIGIAAGEKHFLKAAPETYRRAALGLLMTLAASGLIRAALG